MTADNVFISFSALSLAATGLALVIGWHDFDLRKLAMALINGVRRAFDGNSGKRANVHRKTEIADAMMRARSEGQRYVPPSDFGRAIR